MIVREHPVSWRAILLFYATILGVIAALDVANDLLTKHHVIVQVGMVTLGVGIFALVGWRIPGIRAQHGVLLAFTVGVLTIIPAVLMGLGARSAFWPQYFLVASGMAGGSFLSFLFVRFAARFASNRDEADDLQGR